jgi:toxin ParE1/3/4
MAFVLAPRADRDLEEIADYIAEDNPDRAVTFIDELLVRCAVIDEQPLAYPRRDEFGAGIRMAIHARYRILFRTGSEGVRIERVLHSARRLPRRL